MKRSETRPDAVKPLIPKIPRKIPHVWNRVFNDRKQRVRGLWERNGTFYAQLRAAGKPIRFRLEHAATVSQAVTELQILKKQARSGTLAPTTKVGQKVGHTIKDLSAEYQQHTKDLGDKDLKTRNRERSGLHAWEKFTGDLDIAKVNDALLLEFAKWRKTAAGGEVSGRCIDLDVRAMRHALKRAVALEWLKSVPIGDWKKMAKKPKTVRLITPEELDQYCAAE